MRRPPLRSGPSDDTPGLAHAPLWAALHARTFAVHVADRAETVLRSWTRDGDGQAVTHGAGETQADPEIQQELRRLDLAIRSGDRQLLQAAGGFHEASERLAFLRTLPAGVPTNDGRRGAIDRYVTWSTLRLIKLAPRR